MQKPDPSSIPLSPGVYLYRDGKGQVIYVGKARILRRRVLSYFRPEGLPAKTKAMLAHAQSIEFLTTTTEKEALLLEASLIKKYRPHYNIVLRDDKQYVLFRVNIKHPFPRLEVVRKARRDGARYFGPFTSSLAARETWKLLHRAFPLRRCSDRAMKNRVRPCLYHHMGQCPAPCMGLVTAEDYLEGVRRVCDLLQGKADPLLKELRSRMEAAAEALEFEQAAVLRDQIRAVEKTVERQATVLPGGGDMDPQFYGQERIPACGEPNLLRDAAEPPLLRAFLAADKPVLGICRGIQVMNVVLGGTLYQDIKPFAHVPHNDHWAKIHTVTVRRGTKLEQILGQDTVLVNSQHHQAVDRIAPGLTLAALSEDGIVEAIEKPDAKFCLGVQWHPEWLSAADPAMQGLFDAFVAACRH